MAVEDLSRPGDLSSPDVGLVVRHPVHPPPLLLQQCLLPPTSCLPGTVRGESRDIGPRLSQRLVKLAFPCCGLLLHTSLCLSPDQLMQVP